MAAQIEQGGLFDSLRGANALHQSVGGVGLAGLAAASLGAPNEHSSMVRRILGFVSST
jgi:hypothetical protein